MVYVDAQKLSTKTGNPEGRPNKFSTLATLQEDGVSIRRSIDHCSLLKPWSWYTVNAEVTSMNNGQEWTSETTSLGTYVVPSANKDAGSNNDADNTNTTATSHGKQK